MFKKRLLLTAAALLLLCAFMLLPQNRKWRGQIYGYVEDFKTQKNKLDRETRMRTRFGNGYIISKNIADELKAKGVHRNALVLVPPPDYFSKHGIFYPVPESSVFYYYTDLKVIWCFSADAINANWYVRLDENNKVVADSVTDKKSLQDTIDSYKKWLPRP